MHTLLRALVGVTAGTTCGAVLGALMLAVPTWFEGGCGPLGCVRDWTPLAVYLGAVLGCVPGAVIGMIVGVFSLGLRKSAVAGAAVGLAVAVILFVMGAAGDALISGLAVISIPAGVLVGFLARKTLGLTVDGRA